MEKNILKNTKKWQLYNKIIWMPYNSQSPETVVSHSMQIVINLI